MKRLFSARLGRVITSWLGMAAATASVAVAAGTTDQVTIRRDDYGVPHIYAQTTYGVFYGYGYAVAQDRLFQMEMTKRSTQGTVAEVLGQDYLKHDQSVRANYWPQDIKDQIELLSADDRAILRGYADGMNAWVDQVRANPSQHMPKQFNDFGFAPSRWTDFDVAMVFVGTMANRYSDANSEIFNLGLRQALIQQHGPSKGAALFDQIKWRTNANAPTTVPLANGRYQPTQQAMAQPLPTAAVSPQVALAQAPVHNITTSNFWAVGKAKANGANAVLLNGPQFNWFNPAYVYEVGLHGGGFNVVGNTPFAYPTILFGHNDRIGWGATAGVGDGVDIFAEQLHPTDSKRYRYKNAWHTMQTRVDRIRVKGQAEPLSLAVSRTVHGIVVQSDPQAHVAYAKARAWHGKELQSLMAWTRSTQANNWSQWQSWAQQHALTINWYYADRDGNIGYYHTGAYPARAAGHDPRLPVPGTGEWDWQGNLPASTNPHVYNPAQGYIANWNNSPQANYPATDHYSILWGSADRVDEITQRLEAKPTLTADDMWNLVQETSSVDLNARLFLPLMREAAQRLPAQSPVHAMMALIKDWDGHNRVAANGFEATTPGSVIVGAWLHAMLQDTLLPLIPEPYRARYAGAGYWSDGGARNPASVNFPAGVKVLYEALRGPQAGVTQTVDALGGRDPRDVAAKALQQAYQTLVNRHGSGLSNWRTPMVAVTFSDKNFFGVPQALPSEAISRRPFANRGTENNLLVFDATGSKGWDAVAPGQSGYVDPQGKPSPHTRDQLDMYLSYGKKPMHFLAQDVQSHQQSVTQLTVGTP